MDRLSSGRDGVLALFPREPSGDGPRGAPLRLASPRAELCLAAAFSLLLGSCGLLELFGLGGGGKLELDKAWEEGYPCAPFLSIVAGSGYLYASAGTEGIRVYSLANPSSPAFLRNVTGQANGYYDLALGGDGSSRFLAASSGRGFDVFSLADSATPARTVTSAANTASYSIERIAFGGSVLAAATPSSSTWSPMFLYGLASGSWNSTYIDGSYTTAPGHASKDVAVTALSGKTYACGIVAAPSVGGSLRTLKAYAVDATGAESSGYSVTYYQFLDLGQYGSFGSTLAAIGASDGTLAALAGDSSSSALYALSLAAGPTLGLRGSVSLGGAPRGVAMDGTTAFVLVDGTIAAYDLSASPKLLAEIAVSFTAGSEPRALALYGDYLYTGGASGLMTYSTR